jgi:hypothetical protein
MAIPGFRRLLGMSEKQRKDQRRVSRRHTFRQQLGRQLAHEPLEARMLLSTTPFPPLIDGLPVNPVLDEGQMLLVAIGAPPTGERPRVTYNVNAADTTNADQLQPGGALGLNLTGAGLSVGVWDEAAVRATHQEFVGRVVSGDGVPALSDHATHVAGTIGASGVNPAAKGMATGVRLVSYDWNNDYAEMTAAAAQLVASNHSYGFVNGWAVRPVGAMTPSGWVDWWYEDRFLQAVEDTAFGKYNQSSRDLDQVLYDNPDLISVWASGNDRNDAFANASTNNQYVAWFSGDPGGIGWTAAGWYLVPNAGATAAPPGDGNGGTGYDTLSTQQTAKNSLVVGSVLDVLNDPYTSSDIVTSVFSSYGPTDDGRVKPDVVGNGQGVFSTLSGGNAAYGNMSGTSMAAPNVTGTIALLAEHYENRFGSAPDAATKKGVVIHTAADAGNRGPDYAYGWGLVNAADAATFISNAAVGTGGDAIIQGTYTGADLTYRFTSDGSQPMKATLVWHDPAGPTHPANVLDVRTRVLVHDLDLSVSNASGTVFHPWTLDVENPALPAVRTGPNRVDNVEQVLIDTPQLGTYTVQVSALGGVSNQAFTLLVSGANIVGGGGVRPVPPARQVPVIGPQLIAARPNEGPLLLPQAANAALEVAPREMQLLFRGGENIGNLGTDLSQSIRITRQGTDGAFDFAYAKTDFYTGAGANEEDRVELTLEALQLGQNENGITVAFTKSDHGSSSRAPRISVVGNMIAVDLNSQAGYQTTGGALRDALNGDPAVDGMIRATVTGNTALPLTDNLPRAASVRSDMNTVTSPQLGGWAELEFTAANVGTAGNSLQLVITKSDHANQNMGPFISVVGQTIFADLNSEDGYRTRAQQLVDAINQHPVAGGLVRGRVVAGSLLADLAAVEIDYSPLQLAQGHDGNGHLTPLAPLVLSGAGAAEVSESFEVQGLEVRFRAVQPGVDGNGLQVAVLAANRGVNQPPLVAVAGRKITVTLNTNASTPRVSARDLVNAINAHPVARTLVEAAIVLGDYQLASPGVAPAAASIAAAAPRTVRLDGADEVIVPGYIGLGDTGSEIIIRFAETLPDDNYRLEIFGVDDANLGVRALRNASGVPLTPLEAGADRDIIDFELNLAPQIVSVVPQPVTKLIQVRLTTLPADGDFQLIFQGERTANLPHNATAAAVQTALEALEQIETGEVQVSGPVGGPWKVAFFGRYVNLPLADLLSDEAVVNIRYLSELAQAGDQVLVYFNDDDLRRESAENPAHYRLVDTAGTLAVEDDVILVPDRVYYDPDRDMAVLTFNGRLPHGTYRLDIGQSSGSHGSLSTAVPVGTLFDTTDYETVSWLAAGGSDFYQIWLPETTDLDVRVTADVERTAFGRLDARIELLNDAGDPVGPPSNEVQTLAFAGIIPAAGDFQLIFDGETTGLLPFDADAAAVEAALLALTAILPGDVAVTGGPLPAAPLEIEFSGGLTGASVPRLLVTGNTTGSRLLVAKEDRLQSPNLSAGTYYVKVSSFDGAGVANSGSYFLRMQSTAAVPDDDDNSSFTTATVLGVLGAAAQPVSAQIEPQTWIVMPPYAGGKDEPGHRDIPAEEHILGPASAIAGTDPYAPTGITQFRYFFGDIYGVDAQGNGLSNQITAEQKIRVREIFDLWAAELGIEFIEVADPAQQTIFDLQVVRGETRVVTPADPPGVLGVTNTGQLAAVMNAQTFAGDHLYGGGWFETSMHEIGHAIGLDHSYEQLSIMGEGDPRRLDPAYTGPAPEPVFPYDPDLVHGRRIHRPDSTDIDLYKFELQQAGWFTAETVAQRASSLLDTVLTLFDADGNVVARNDDYYSKDSMIELQLGAGTYFVGVTSKGNTAYDPTVRDSGFGGTTDGHYELRLGFLPERENGLVDASAAAVELDGNNNGRPGGLFQFWFQAGDESILVDKSRSTSPGNPEGTGTAADPYDSIAWAMADAATRIVMPPRGPSAVQDGETFRFQLGATTHVFEFDVDGQGVQPGRVSVPVPQTEIQRLSYTAVPSSGQFTLTFGTATTAALNFNASAVDVQAALEALPDIEPGELRVTGGPLLGAPIDVEFRGRFIGRQVPQLRVTDNAVLPGGAGLRITPVQNLAVAVRNAINLLVPPSAPIAALTPAGTAVKVTGITRLNASGTPGLLTSSNLVRVAGNPGADNDPTTVGDSMPYLIGTNNLNQPLEDGDGVTVPQGVTLMIDEGALLKLRKANIDVGLTQPNVDRRAGAVQVLGTPDRPVLFRSYHDDALGGNTDPNDKPAEPGDWGGLVFRNASDHEDRGIFLNWVNHADLRHGGGKVFVGSVQSDYTPVYLASSRPTVAHSTVTASAGAAISADPNSFDDRGGRIGPDIHGNRVVDNSINGLLVRIRTQDGAPLDKLDVSARFDDTDIVHVITENLHIAGNPGGPVLTATGLQPRLSGRLAIDPAVVVKLGSARIEAERGASNLIAEGTEGYPVIFTSTADDTYGFGGTFDTNGDRASTNRAPRPGDWGGLIFNALSHGSLDRAVVSYGGGEIPIEGGFARFNAIEVQQADFRLTRSLIQNNAAGQETANANRNGRLSNEAAAVFVRGAQPSIVDNVFMDNLGAAVHINAGSLSARVIPDTGRSTGEADRFAQFDDNHGPLVRLNRLANNAVNGLLVRGAMLTTASVWDDTDIVHVLLDEIMVVNQHTEGGLRLQSSPNESLVVKLEGDNAGFTASGTRMDIDDRIGGTLHILGTVGHPVVLTALADDTVGAGFDPWGRPQLDTNSDGSGGGGGLLPTGPEVDNGTLIDNDVPQNVPGFFSVRPAAGGRITQSGVTAQGNATLFTNADWIFAFNNYIDVGANGLAFDLGFTTVTQPPTLVSPDVVVSQGTFPGPNGTVTWRAETFLNNGEAKVFNRVTFSSAAPLGNIRLVNYLDEDIFFVSDDILWLTGTPGQPDFRAFTLDGPERVGFSQGGIYVPGPDLVNATYDGWAADRFSQLVSAITGPGTTYSIAGNIDLADLPASTDPELGTIYGPADVTTAFAWSVNPTATTATITSFLELVPRNPALAGGQWRSVKLDQYSHDRNVATVNEIEPSYTSDRDINAIPDTAENLGTLAPDEKSGDETRRLGFEVRGHVSLNDPADMDVYSFNGTAGTVVWFDLDRTTPTLHTVLELIDSRGEVLASSEDLAGTLAESLTPQPWEGDFYSTNRNDAGMRVTLPGNPGETGTYFVRVRSAGPMLADSPLTSVAFRHYDDAPDEITVSSAIPGETFLDKGFEPGQRLFIRGSSQSGISNDGVYTIAAVTDNGTFQTITLDPRDRLTDQAAPTGTTLRAGLTSGGYQLQIRLRQTDEQPGSVVRYADIRFATNGIEIVGLPSHSNLLGESGEVSDAANNTAGGAQNLGNLLLSERNVVSVGGALSSANDVDWYSFTLDYDFIQNAPGSTDGGKTFPLVFDVDYADGLTRPDTTLALFVQNPAVPDDIRLIAIARESNVQDDQPRPGFNLDLADLARGSAGKLDPFLGGIYLPAGTVPNQTTYLVALMSDNRLPTAMTATLLAGSGQAQVRLEPVNSVRRIVEDHIGFVGYTSGDPNALPPDLPPQHIAPETGAILDITDAVSLATHVRPFTFADVQLYVTQGNFTGAALWSVNPSTGDVLTRVSAAAGLQTVQDIHMRSDGFLYGYRRLPGDAGNAGQLVQIDTSTGAIQIINDDGIPGHVPTPVNIFNNQATTTDWVDALTFERTGTAAFRTPTYTAYYAVREQDAASPTFSSKLYQANATTGVAGGNVRGDIQPAGVTKAARTIFVSDGNAANGTATIQLESKSPGPAGNGVGVFFTTVLPGAQVQVFGETVFVRLATNAAGDVTTTAQQIVDAINGNAAARNLVLAGLAPGSAAGEEARNLAGFYPMTVLGQGVPLRGYVTGLALGEYTGGRLYGVTSEGEFIEINKGNGQATVIRDLQADFGISDLQGLARGPQNVEDGAFRDLLFTVTGNGDLYALDPATGIPQLVFNAGNEVQEIELTGSPTDGTFTLTFDGETTSPIPIYTMGNLNQNTLQTVQFLGNPTGGSFNLTFDNGVLVETTPPIAYNAPLNVGIDEVQRVALSGTTGGTFTLTFDGQTTGPIVFNAPASVDVDEVQQVQLVGATGGSFTLTFDGQTTSPIGFNAPAFTGVNERQEVSLVGGANGGTFNLEFQGFTTNAINWNATAAAVQTALVALPNVGAGDVLVTGGPLPGAPITVEFQGTYGNRNVAPMTTINNMTPPGADAVVTTLVQGTQSVFAALSALPNITPGDIQVGGGPLPATPVTVQFMGTLGGLNQPQMIGDPAGLTGPGFVNVNVSTVTQGQTSIRRHLETLSNIDPGDVVATGGALPGTPVDVQFTGQYAGLNVPQMTASGAGLIGTPPVVSVSTPVQGVPSVRMQLESLAGIDAGEIIVSGGPLPASAFTVEFAGQFSGTVVNQMTGSGAALTGTPPLGVTVTTAQLGTPSLQTILEGLPNINPGDVMVTGGPLNVTPIRVAFTGIYAGMDVSLMTADDSSLVPAPPLSGVTVTTAGTIFDGNPDSTMINVGLFGVTGLAFSPLDFNLWHPTTTRGGEQGHGIPAAPDNSRIPSAALVDVQGGLTSKTASEAAGHTSFYFGLDRFEDARISDDASQYYRYQSLGQYGILEGDVHLDLSSNPNIVVGERGTYNLPGGAYGSLITGEFSLAEYVSADKPTLYFNYFLETENHAGATLESNAANPFRDSARVFISRDDGLTWELLATNNSQLSAPAPTPLNAELPRFLSDSATEGLNASVPALSVPPIRQQVQELFDNTGVWRQARVDLGVYAGQPNLMLRFDFSTAGTMNDPSLGAVDANFGEFQNGLRSIRSQNNQFEGFFIDDIIVGLSERGEMVTGATGQTATTDLTANARTNPQGAPRRLDGNYQLEIRRGPDYANLVSLASETIVVEQTFGSNERHVAGYTLIAPDPLSLTDGTQFAIAGKQWAVFEYDRNGVVSDGAVRINLTGVTTAPQLAQRIRDAINGMSGLGVTAIMSGAPGSVRVDLVDALEITHDPDAIEVEAYNRKGDANFRREQGQVIIENNVISGSSEFAVRIGAGSRQPNNNLPQPGVPIRFDTPNNVVTVNNNPNLRTGLAPGVVVQNNILAYSGSGGVSFRGDPAASLPYAAAPFGRIVNNTIYGSSSQTGTGILVADNAAPTILNNVLSGLTTGINVSANSAGATVSGWNLYQNNVNNGNSVNPVNDLVRPAGDPLFYDAEGGNFYLRPGSTAIDSGLNTMQDRAAFVQVKQPLGIPASPLFSPSRDVYGQLRVDLPWADPLGAGPSVFRDRGAVEAADFERPFARLADPVDGDSLDRDPNATVVYRTDDRLFEEFVLQLFDGPGSPRPIEGTGVETSTVHANSVSMARDGVLLVEQTQVVYGGSGSDFEPGASDYTLGYEGTNQVLRLTPDSRVWEFDRTYVITLNNKDRYLLKTPSGAAVQDGDQFLIRDGNGNAVTFEYESGYKMWVPQTLTIHAVEAGQIRDGDTFAIGDGASIVVFEFDNNNTFNPANRVIRYSSTDTKEDIARKIFQVLEQDRTLGLAPRYLGDRVHIGSRSNHLMNVSLNSNLTQSGFAGGVADGDQFTIDFTVNGVAQTVTFEFDSDGSLLDPDAPMPVVVPFDYSGTNEELAVAVVEAIRTAVPKLGATVHLGDGFVHLRESVDAGLQSYVLNTSLSRLWQTGQPGVTGALMIQLPNDVHEIQTPAGGAADISDNERFVIDDGTRAVTFEFDRDFSGPTRSQYVPIQLSGLETQDELAALIQNAITAPEAFPTFAVTYLGSGVLQFTVRPGGRLDTSGTAQLTGVVRSGVADGETFQITRAGVPVTFEFNNNGVFDPNHIQIGFGPASSGDFVAGAMITAIQNVSGLGLAPVYLGGGTIRLNETPQHAFLRLGSSLSVTGVPGGAVAVPYVPDQSFTAENMAGAVISAVNRTGFAGFGATAKLRGGNTIFLDNARLNAANPDPDDAVQVITAGAIQAEFVAGIRDRAGNYLQANQPDGETRFTIILGQVAFDYGDLPDNPARNDDFPTLLGSDGARHVQVRDNPLRLGSRLGTEVEGQPTAAADGDDAGARVDLADAPGLSLSLLPLSTIQVPDGWHITDGSVFSITDAGGTLIEFTLVKNGTNPSPEVPYTVHDRPEELAERVVEAILALTDSGLGSLTGIAAVHVGGGVVQVAGAAEIRLTGLPVPSMESGLHLLATAPITVQIPGDPNAGGQALIADGDTVTLQRGGETVTFTFESPGGPAAPTPTVPFFDGETPEILARRLVKAVEDAVLSGVLDGVTAVHVGNGVVEFRGADELTWSGGLRPFRRLPVRIDVTLLPVDEDRFTLADGRNTAVVFEFDNDANLSNNAYQRIVLGGNAAATAANIAAAINQAVADGLLQGVTASESGTSVSLVPHGVGADLAADDEDGVRFDGIFAKGYATPILVTASGHGFLDAWVDWNNNGRFDPGEQVFVNEPVFEGENRLTITAPDTIDDALIPFYTFARFRISPSGGLAPYGLGVGGEVEDYRIRIMANTAPQLVVPIPIPVPPAAPPLPALIQVLEDNPLGEHVQFDLSWNFDDEDVSNGNGDFLTYSVTLHGFAAAVTDLGTGGAVYVRLEADLPGPAGEAIRLVVSESDRGGTSGPGISVTGSTIQAELNTNPANPTTAQQLVDAINAHAAAGVLVTASIVRGAGSQILAGIDLDSYSPLPLAISRPVDYELDGSHLTLTYLQDQNGKAVLVATAADQTGATVSTTVTITVLPVNDAPQFLTGVDPVTVNEDAGLQTLANWATDILPGPPTAIDESIQSLQFLVTVLGSGSLTAAHFTVPPAIDAATGTLTFQAAPNANGEAHVTVALRDDGGTVNGGVDTSAVQTFTITVRPINDPPVLTAPTTTQTVDEDQPLTFSLAGSNGISVADPDVAEAAPEELRLTLSVLQGTLTLGTTAGLTFDDGDGTTDAAMIFRGTQAAVNAALNGLVYLPRLDYNGTDRLVVTVNDLGNFGYDPNDPDVWSSGVDVQRTVSITVRPVNDPPTVVLPNTFYQMFEDNNLPIQGIVVGDAKDAAYAPVTLRVTLSASYGTITVNTNVPGGVLAGAVLNNGTGSVRLTGSPAALNATLAHATGVVYRPLLNFNNFTVDGTSDPNEEVIVTVNDLGNVGSGGALEVKGTVTVSVLQVNDPPSITAPGSLILNEDNPAFYIPLIVTDVDADESPADPTMAVTVVLRLTDVAGNPLTTAGTLTVRTDVPGGLDPTPVTGNGTLAGNGTAHVTITGSPAKITQTLLNATGLHFLPAENWNGTLQLVASVEDHGNSGTGTALSQTVTIPVLVNPVNDPPVVTVPTGPFVIDEGPGNNITLYGIGVTDVDASETPPGYVVVTLSVPLGHGSLSVVAGAPGGVPAGRITDNNTRSITLTGTPLEINQTLALPRGVTYTVPDGDFNNNRAGGDVILTVHADDQGRTGSGAVTTDTETVAITVTPVNDLPVITVPGLQTLNEGPGASRAIAGIRVDDVDFEELGPADLTVYLSIPAGQGTLTVTSGVPGGATNIAGNGTNAVTLTGRIAQINATLGAAAGVAYTVPHGDFNATNNGGPVILTVRTNDGGRTGAASGVDVTAMVPIQVNPINDPPTLVVPAALQIFNEDHTLTFHAAGGNAILINDVDANEADPDLNALRVTLTASSGTLTLGPGVDLSGLNFLAGDGTADQIMTFEGTVTEVQQAVDGLVYSPVLHFNGPAAITVRVDDRGNFGDGPFGNGAVVTGTISLSITAVNDPPQIIAPADNLQGVENVPLQITSISVVDPDLPNINPDVPSNRVTMT